MRPVHYLAGNHSPPHYSLTRRMPVHACFLLSPQKAIYCPDYSVLRYKGLPDQIRFTFGERNFIGSKRSGILRFVLSVNAKAPSFRLLRFRFTQKRTKPTDFGSFVRTTSTSTSTDESLNAVAVKYRSFLPRMFYACSIVPSRVVYLNDTNVMLMSCTPLVYMRHSSERNLSSGCVLDA